MPSVCTFDHVCYLAPLRRILTITFSVKIPAFDSAACCFRIKATLWEFASGPVAQLPWPHDSFIKAHAHASAWVYSNPFKMLSAPPRNGPATIQKIFNAISIEGFFFFIKVSSMCLCTQQMNAWQCGFCLGPWKKKTFLIRILKRSLGKAYMRRTDETKKEWNVKKRSKHHFTLVWWWVLGRGGRTSAPVSLDTLKGAVWLDYW